MKIVAIVSARKEEAFAALEVFRHRGELQNEEVIRHGHLAYTLGTLPGDVRVSISYAREQGGEFALDHVKDLISHIEPRMVLMTGVCAGLRGKVRLGDLMVSKAAFNYAAGKESSEGKEFASQIVGPPEGFLSWVEHKMKSQNGWAQHPVIANPLIEHDSKQFLLRAIYEYQNHAEDLAASEWLWEFGFDISQGIFGNRSIFRDYNENLESLLASGEVVHLGGGRLQLSETMLTSLESQLHLFDFPRISVTRSPKVDYVTFGSGPSVRSDDLQRYFRFDELVEPNFGRRSKAFHECLAQNRETLALDMESSAFYTAMRNVTNIDFLVVKAVVDHADRKKDDSVHEFGKQLAAGFALEIVRNYSDWTASPSVDTKPSFKKTGFVQIPEVELEVFVSRIDWRVPDFFYWDDFLMDLRLHLSIRNIGQGIARDLFMQTLSLEGAAKQKPRFVPNTNTWQTASGITFVNSFTPVRIAPSQSLGCGILSHHFGRPPVPDLRLVLSVGADGVSAKEFVFELPVQALAAAHAETKKIHLRSRTVDNGPKEACLRAIFPDADLKQIQSNRHF